MPVFSPRAIVFDVNETLSDMAPLQARFEEVGAPGSLAPTWFAGVLRDGFALTAAGGYAEFGEVAADGLRGLLPPESGRSGDAEAAVQHILGGFDRLTVHPEVPDAVRVLRGGGMRLATMTNGSAAFTRGLLERAGIEDCFDELLDVGGPRTWKPGRAAYEYAVERLGVKAEQALLVAVHPWDLDGARRAGLGAAWLRRGASFYPSSMTAPSLVAEDLGELADLLVGR
ncbi:haloacid dehalogenase type II [Streptomyces meridianus]|uniref:Haloacid dehalogenase type II n=1 Tax=Streptomyces meridianus TaxID=2938945 RepID=A0ABT0XBA4_9ACTN|nr:haloacid dehalogenase type II [Streptomyces meridianus]MCM2579585.1 haloacid dehalogenase type II [Streptomyces meridianus]